MAGLIAALAIAAFYTEENIRGSRTLDHANDLARKEHVPLHPSTVHHPAPPQEHNLFYAPAFRNRILWESEDGFEETGNDRGKSSGLPMLIPWGDIHPQFASIGKSLQRQSATTDPAKGRSLNLLATREAMKKLGWTLTETASPANDVRTGLDRYQSELAEWGTEIRQRSGWAPEPASFRSIETFERLLIETTRLFTLRAVAGAAAGRPGSEIFTDLESAHLLSQHTWAAPRFVNAAIWEVLRARSLKDGELLALGNMLPDKPPTNILLQRTWMESIGWITEILTPLGESNGEYSTARYWELYTIPELFPDDLPALRHLKPAGWYRLEEAWMIQVMIENQRWLRQIDAAWDSPSPPPIRQNKIEPPLVAGRHVYYLDDLGYHLQSCGCPVSTIVSQTVDARIAMIAIGLERHRLRHGTWPETLTTVAGLIPRNLRVNPKTGKPFTYQLLPGAGWELSDDDRGTVWRMNEPP
jgi:hypothetical protein